MKKILALVLALILAGSLIACSTEKPEGSVPADGSETEPSVISGPPAALTDGFFVSADGSDDGDGSEAHPFATIQKAVDAIGSLREQGYEDAVTVSVAPGEYFTANVTMSAAVGGPSLEEPTVIRGTGESRDDVILNAATAIDPGLFGPVTDESMRARFDTDVVDKLVVCDLTEAGFTPQQVAKQYAFGSAAQPIGDEYKGTNIAVFAGNTRLDIARYPNTVHENETEAYLTVGEDAVLDEGVRNESGGTIRVNDDAAARMAKWQTIDGVWAAGAFMFDWADESTPLSAYDPETQAVTFLFPSYNGYSTEGKYYFYNAAEELDAPGEYWIDAENMKFYLYPTEADGTGHVSISVTDAPMFTGVFSNITIENLTMTGSRQNFFSSGERSNGLTVRNCVFKNGGASVYNLNGDNNTVFGCEIFNMGKGGCQINGAGDPATLTPGNNRIENNIMHDIGQIQKMYYGGLGVNGVGNIISHNEIYNAPHSVLSAGWENNVIEWNYIHDVAKESNDCGAYYGGGQLISQGNVIRHNKFEDIGCVAIYFDDGLCGWTCYGNLMRNCGTGVICGGGRDLIITNNVFIGCGAAVGYDERMITWYNMEDHPNVYDPEQNAWWKSLDEVPYKEEPWASAFPNLAKIHFDKTREDDIDFLVNPSYSVVENNIYIGEKYRWTFNIEPDVYVYSTIGYNYCNPREESAFEPGTYELTKAAKRDKKLVYEPIPYDGYGTYDAD